MNRPKLARFSLALSLLMLTTAPVCAAPPPTQDVTAPGAGLPAAQARRLVTLRDAAEKIDQNRDPRGYMAAYQQLVAYAQSVYGKDHPAVAKLRLSMVGPRFALGETVGLMEELEASAAIFRAAGPAWKLDLADTLNNISVVADAQGDSARAVGLLEQVVAIRRDAAGARVDPILGVILGNLAWAYRGRTEFARALPVADEGIAMLEAGHAEKPADRDIGDALAVALSNRSIHLSDLGRTADAAEAARVLAVRLDELVGPDSPAAATALISSWVYPLNGGKPAEAEAMVRRAIDIRERAYGRDAGATAQARLSLISVLTAQGRWAEARPIAEFVARGLAQSQGADSPEAIEAQAKLARIDYALGEIERGIAGMRDVIARFKAIRSAAHRDVTDSQDFLASILAREQRWPEAEAVLAELTAARAAAKIPAGIVPSASQVLMALAEAKQGKTAAALTRLEPASVQLVQALDREIRSEGSRGSRYFSLNRGLGWSALAASAVGDQARAFGLAQHYNLGPSDRAVLRTRLRERQTDPAVAEQLRLLQDLIDRRGQAQSALNKASADGDAAAASAAKAQADALTSQIAPLAAQDTGELFETQQLADVQARLRRDEAVFFSIETDLGTRIFAISAHAISVSDAALPTARITALVKAARARLDWGMDDEDAFDTAETDALHAALFTPEVERVLAGKRHVYVIARGELAKLPFGVLTRKRPDGSHQWAIERFAFSYPVVFSRIGEGRQDRRKGQIATFVGIGAPAMPALAAADGRSAPQRAYRGAINSAKIAQLGTLGLADAELRAMARALSSGQTLVLSGAEATEADVRALDLGTADVLTFATHGVIAGELDGLNEAALVLSPPRSAEGGSEDDGLLTSSEIAGLNLTARLAVLSACNSAAGDKDGDEALSGLARAFLQAGVQSLLVSHWRLRDDVAARLTVATAKGSVIKGGAAEGLRRAQLALMKDRSVAGSAHPALWAPFVLVGE